MFKKNFKNFMCNLGKLFTFSFGFLGLFGLIALLGGWTTNNEGNLVSDNLYSGPSSVYYNDYDSDTQIGTLVTIIDFNEFQLSDDETTFYFIFSVPMSEVDNLGNNGYEGFEVEIGYKTSLGYNSYYDISIDNMDNGYDYFRDYGNNIYIQLIDFDLGEYEGNFINYMKITSLGDYLLVNDIMLSYFATIEYQPYNTISYSENNYNIVSNSNLIYHLMNNANAYMFNINPHDTNNSIYDIKYFFNNLNTALYSKTLSLSPLDNNYMLENFSTEISANNPFDIDNTSQQYQVLFVLANPCDTSLTFNLFDNTYDFEITALYNNGLIQVFDTDSISNYYVNIPYDIDNSNSIIAFKVNFYWEDYINIQMMVNSDNATIQMYFDRGYNSAKSEFYPMYLDTLYKYNTALTSIESLRNQVNQLNEQLNNTVGWKPFIFAMADTPFRVVANVLGFEVFGINLYNVLIGLITTLAILWLIKKLRK